MEQRTPEWYLARKGKITASEVVNLLGNHKERMSAEELAGYRIANPKSKVTTKDVPFNDSTYTYLNRKVAELYMDDMAFLEDADAKQINTRALSHGIMYEAQAVQEYESVTGNRVQQAGFIPLRGFEDICGGSPDGIIEDGIIEVKCPWNSEVHLDYCLLTSPEELMELRPQYYAQIQLNILVTGSKFGDFVSFDPRITTDLRLKVLRIPKDATYCKLLLDRIALANLYIYDRIDAINQTQLIITSYE